MSRVPHAILAAGMILASACGTVNTSRTRTAPADDAVALRTKVNDVLTHVFLRATDARLYRTKGGVLETQVDVVNNDFRTRGFSYRFAWLDSRGNVIESPMSVWKTARIPAGGGTTITSTAPTVEATDFSLQVRRAEE